MIRIVNQTRTRGGRLRVLGAGHSWSPLAVSNDLLVSLHKLSGVVSVDKKKKLVTVKGGTTLEELTHVLHQHGLALSNLPTISAQTVAGLLATGESENLHQGVAQYDAHPTSPTFWNLEQ